jgi:xanthine/uracil/vitamin C permease (AzgA family)
MMALGNTVSAFVTNLPFVISPVVPIGIFMRTYLQANGLGVHEGSVATIWAGVLLCIIGSKPFAIIFFKLVPHCLQAAIATGIGFLIALSGMTEIGLIMKGKNSLLEMPEIGPEMYVGLGTVVLIGVLFQVHLAI